MPKRSSKPKPEEPDENQTAWRVIQDVTRERSAILDEEKYAVPETDAPCETDPPKKNPAAVTLGRLGGLKGGKARAEALSPEKRAEIAKKAAEKRWGPK